MEIKLGRNHHLGTLGDNINTLPSWTGYNCLIVKKLREALLLFSPNCCGAALAPGCPKEFASCLIRTHNGFIRGNGPIQAAGAVTRSLIRATTSATARSTSGDICWVNSLISLTSTSRMRISAGISSGKQT